MQLSNSRAHLKWYNFYRSVKFGNGKVLETYTLRTQYITSNSNNAPLIQIYGNT